MSTTSHPTAAVRARVDRRSRFSLIWLIPIITALIGGWLAWDTLSKRGPTITISFESGEGLQAGQSRVKHKDVALGLVTGVALSPDATHVLVTVQMNREADRFLTEGAKFWVVTPRLFAGSISGLDTLISGAYIELLPSDTPGQATAREFVGLENPPVLTSNEPGRTFLLHADRIGSVNLGSPVFYRGLSVGTVLGWDLGDMAKHVTIHAFVRHPFDDYVHEQSRFWNASGVSVKLGAQGVQVELESIKALLLGGIAFETPTDALQSPVSAVNSEFHLYADQEAANNAAYQRRIPLVGYFPGSVGGLTAGSPVTFHGLRIGEVIGISLEWDPKTDLVQTPVRFEVEPDRFAHSEAAQKRGPMANARWLVQHGMRAQIQSANLLTGQSEVSLDFFPDAAPAEITMTGDALVVPTVGGQFADLSRSVNELLSRLNQIPFDQIGQSLKALLAGANALTSGPETRQAIQSLSATMTATEDLVKRLDAGASPALHRLPEIASSLQAMLANTNKLVASADAGYGDNSKFHRDLDRVMVQLNDMVQSLRVLADLLTRHPEALVRGRTSTGSE
jgi:paraquat-inducible protein B